jgi:hypothetical protein
VNIQGAEQVTTARTPDRSWMRGGS